MTKDHVSINRDVWNADAIHYAPLGDRLWALDTPEWGIWANSENDLHVLPADMTGQTAIELGCGTAYVSAWMHRRGATVTGIDVSPEQLATARRLNAEHKTGIILIEGNAEATGLPDASFDFAISEYGAAIWCPPDVWLAEAWRLLRPGGKLVFLGNHPLAIICSPLSGAPANHTLHRSYRSLNRIDWTEVEEDPSGICFCLPTAEWMTLFAEIGFEIDRYQELYAPAEATGVRAFIPADWAKDYPTEQIWHLRKPAP